jgi:hypothetical protein
MRERHSFRAAKWRHEAIRSGETFSCAFFGTGSRVVSEPAEQPHSVRTPFAAEPEPYPIRCQAPTTPKEKMNSCALLHGPKEPERPSEKTLME